MGRLARPPPCSPGLPPPDSAASPHLLKGSSSRHPLSLFQPLCKSSPWESTRRGSVLLRAHGVGGGGAYFFPIPPLEDRTVPLTCTALDLPLKLAHLKSAALRLLQTCLPGSEGPSEALSRHRPGKTGRDPAASKEQEGREEGENAKRAQGPSVRAHRPLLGPGPGPLSLPSGCSVVRCSSNPG